MALKFHTQNINPRLYKRAIQYYLYFTLGIRDFISFNRTWKIDFYSHEESINNKNFGDINVKGVGGVTGMNTIKLYIYDKDDLKNSLYPFFRPNMMVITHELAHAVLIHKKITHRVVLRNDDWGGNRKGKTLNFSTAEVHDRHIEGKMWNMNFNFWDWHKFKNYKMRCTALDIRDITKT